MRRAAKVDANQRAIVEALRAIGATVYYIKEPVDLLVGLRGVNYLLEVKDVGGRFTKSQVEFVATWAGECHVVRTPTEALSAILGDAMK